MRLAQEEIFSPVLAVEALVEALEEGIALADKEEGSGAPA